MYGCVSVKETQQNKKSQCLKEDANNYEGHPPPSFAVFFSLSHTHMHKGTLCVAGNVRSARSLH